MLAKYRRKSTTGRSCLYYNFLCLTESSGIYAFCLFKSQRPICSGPKVKAMKEIYSKIASLFTLVHSTLDVEPNSESISQDTLPSTMIAFSHIHKPLLILYVQRELWWYSNQILKIIFKGTHFSGVFCVHASTLRKGYYKYPMISQSWMERSWKGLPNFCLPLHLLTHQALFCALHLILGCTKSIR